MWFFSKNNNKLKEERDEIRSAKALKGQNALIQAATATADAAGDVTTLLKGRLDDSLRQIEITSQLLTDALISCSSVGLLESINPAAERIFGWKRTDIQGMEINTLFRNDMGKPMSSIDIISKLFSCCDNHLSDGVNNQCIRGKRRNGEIFWMEINVSQVILATGDNRIIMICRDASQRMETKRILELNEHRFRSIFEASLDGIFVAQNDVILAANPAIANMLNYTSESMIAKPLIQFVHPDHQEAVSTLHAQRRLGDMQPKSYVIKLLKADSTVVEVLVSSTGMTWDNGKNASLMMIKNISNLK